MFFFSVYYYLILTNRVFCMLKAMYCICLFAINSSLIDLKKKVLKEQIFSNFKRKAIEKRNKN